MGDSEVAGDHTSEVSTLGPTRVLYGKGLIAGRVRELAYEINEHYRGQQVTLLPVMKGAFVFAADLIRELERFVPSVVEQVAFIEASRYAGDHPGSERCKVRLPSFGAISHNLLIVEDIVDEGYTAAQIMVEMIRVYPRGVANISIAALIDRQVKRQTDIRVKFSCFVLEDKRFVIGYGMDLNERYRGLSEIVVRDDSRS